MGIGGLVLAALGAFLLAALFEANAKIGGALIVLVVFGMIVTAQNRGYITSTLPGGGSTP